MTAKHTHPLLQTAYITAHSLTLLIAGLLSPFAIGLILTSARTSGAQIYSPIGILPEVITAAIVLHILLRFIAPQDLNNSRKFAKASGGSAVLAIFTIISAILFALLTVALFATIVWNIQAYYYMGLGNLVLNIVFVGSMLVISGVLTNYYARTITKRSKARRSASDWFFDQVELVIKKARKLPLVSR